MSLHPQPHSAIPDETRRVAHAAFPKGALGLRIADELGPLYRDDQFADLFPTRGQPAASPARLALASVLQYIEGLTDRQAADAVRGRLDWKYVLGLELTDPGFDHTVLSEFRARLVDGDGEAYLLDALLKACQAKGWLKARGRQRTDSTHILAAIHTLHRVELVGQTLQAALDDLATIAPMWLKSRVPMDWFERYGRKVDNYRLPKAEAERQVVAEQIGQDGLQLLTWVDEATTSTEIRS